MTDASVTRKEKIVRSIARLWSAGGMIGVALLGGTWYALSFRPANIRLDEAWSQVDEAYDYLATEETLQRKLDEALCEAKILADRRQAAAARVPQEADEVAFLSWMSRNSSDWDLAIEDYRPGSSISYSDYQGRILQLGGEGSYQSILRMLDGLRRCERMNRVAALAINPADERRAQFVFTLQVELLTRPDAEALTMMDGQTESLQ